MIKLVVSACCLSVLFCAPAFSQQAKTEDTDSKNFFYGSPFSIFLNTFEIAYEHNLKNNNSVMILGGATLSNGKNTGRTGGEGEIHYRVNMSKHPAKISSGLQVFTFFAPYVRADYQDINEHNAYYSGYNGGTTYPSSLNSHTFVRSFSGGLLFGIRLSSSENRFSSALYAGGGMKASDVNGNQDYTDVFRVGYTGVIPKVGFQVGISF